MKRQGFVYKISIAPSMQAEEVVQQAFIRRYDELMTSLGPDEKVLFADSVHPELSIKSVLLMAGFRRETVIRTKSDRKRLNIQGAHDIETSHFTFVEGEKINVETTRQLQEKIERDYLTQTASHVILDNAYYQHANPSSAFLTNAIS